MTSRPLWTNEVCGDSKYDLVHGISEARVQSLNHRLTSFADDPPYLILKNECHNWHQISLSYFWPNLKSCVWHIAMIDDGTFYLCKYGHHPNYDSPEQFRKMFSNCDISADDHQFSDPMSKVWNEENTLTSRTGATVRKCDLIAEHHHIINYYLKPACGKKHI